MAEPPDFEQIARQAISGSEFHIRRVTEQLRLVWNARGAADIHAIESPFMGLGPFREKVNDAIRSLDR
jgi:hypothetical protein